MSKITLSDVTTLTNETSFLSTTNANYAAIETAGDTFLSLDGTAPNQMAAALDMNSNRILNLPAPETSTEPLRLQDLSDFLTGGDININAAPTTASYLTLGTNADLTSERVLTAGSGVSFIDGGAGSTLTINVTATGNVVGPASSTDLAVVKFDSTTGKLLKNSAIVINSSNALCPDTDDGGALGTTSLRWSDLFMPSGGVINWAAGDVTLTHSTNHLRFASASNGYSFDAPLIKSTTTTPITITSFAPAFQSLGTTAATSIGFLSGRWVADNNGPAYYMYKSRNATIGSHTIVQSGDILGELWWAGDNGTGENYAANIRCEVDGTPGVGDMPGRIVFATSADGSGSPTDRATLSSAGNWTLTGSSTILSATAVPAGGTAGSGFKFSSTTNLGLFFGSGAPSLSAAQGSLYIRTDGSSSSTRLYVNSNGSTTWVNITSAS